MKNSAYLIAKVTLEENQELSMEKIKELFEQISKSDEFKVHLRPIEIHDVFPLAIK